jgi:ATP-dependent DNA helicase PIF1
MLLCNLDVESGLCNGSTGRVLSFDESKMPIVLFNNGITLRMEPYVWNISDTNEYGKRKVIASRKQIPLAVAYSITAHKSQGLTLDHVEIDCNGVFTNGQLYVMLSRASSMEGLIIRNFDFKSIMVDHRVIKFYEDLKKQIKPMLE